MSTSQETGAAAPTAAATDASSTSTEQQISLSLPSPAAIEPPTASACEPIKPVGPGKVIEMPKPVEAVMQAAEAMRAAEADKAPVAPLEEPAIVPPVKDVVDDQRSNRFALLAASVAFAGALGAMAGALGTSVVSRSTATETPMAGVDLAPVRDAIASLRTEIGAIKSSVETSNRNANAQLAKFNERLERIDRAQSASAAQRAQTPSGTVTGSVQPQQAAAVPVAPAAAPPAEAARQRVIEGWTVRHVSRGVAVIQGRRMGAIEVEAGDIVPGVGRIESIRRQDGRWIVLTSNGMITSPTPR
ncbi:MAG: hypothetical protein K2Y71_07250 [Xanthobacteraceae bacterium]|nr:hypothetical protein [Xanthobacteraceae bacterium]